MNELTAIVKIAVFSAISAHKKRAHIYPRVGIFTSGTAIEAFYINRKEQVFNITNEERSNAYVHNLVFSLIWQSFMNSIVYDDLALIRQDALDILVTYAAIIPLLVVDPSKK